MCYVVPNVARTRIHTVPEAGEIVIIALENPYNPPPPISLDTVLAAIEDDNATDPEPEDQTNFDEDFDIPIPNNISGQIEETIDIRFHFGHFPPESDPSITQVPEPEDISESTIVDTLLPAALEMPPSVSNDIKDLLHSLMEDRVLAGVLVIGRYLDSSCRLLYTVAKTFDLQIPRFIIQDSDTKVDFIMNKVSLDRVLSFPTNRLNFGMQLHFDRFAFRMLLAQHVNVSFLSTGITDREMTEPDDYESAIEAHATQVYEFIGRMQEEHTRFYIYCIDIMPEEEGEDKGDEANAVTGPVNLDEEVD